MTELTRQPYAGATEAIHRILNREAEADEVLRRVVRVLHERIPHYAWAGLYFVEDGELVLGPGACVAPAERPRIALGDTAIGRVTASGLAELDVLVVYRGRTVAAIHVEAASPAAFERDDRTFLERVATLVSAHCLVGWDTGGVPWDAPG